MIHMIIDRRIKLHFFMQQSYLSINLRNIMNSYLIRMRASILSKNMFTIFQDQSLTLEHQNNSNIFRNSSEIIDDSNSSNQESIDYDPFSVRCYSQSSYELSKWLFENQLEYKIQMFEYSIYHETSLKTIIKKKQQVQKDIQHTKKIFEAKIKELRFFYGAKEKQYNLAQTSWQKYRVRSSLITFNKKRKILTYFQTNRLRKAILKKQFNQKQLAQIYNISVAKVLKEEKIVRAIQEKKKKRRNNK